MASKQKASDKSFSFGRAFDSIFKIFALVYICLEWQKANEKELLREKRRAHELNNFELFFFIVCTKCFSAFHLELLVYEIR